MTETLCPVCFKPARIRDDAGFDRAAVQCPRCGVFRMTGSAIASSDHLTGGGTKRFRLSAAVRRMFESGEEPVLTTANVPALIEATEPPKTMPDGIDLLLQEIERRTDNAVDWLKFDRDTNYPLVVGRDGGDLAEYLRVARDDGMIEWKSGDNVRLTNRGWERLRVLKERSSNLGTSAELPEEWKRAERQLAAARRVASAANNEEEFQAAGLMCREALISAAQSVYDVEKHASSDGTIPSGTDAKRMFDAIIASRLAGRSHEAERRFARAAVDLTNDLQHSRTATKAEALMCIEATASVLALVRIMFTEEERG